MRLCCVALSDVFLLAFVWFALGRRVRRKMADKEVQFKQTTRTNTPSPPPVVAVNHLNTVAHLGGWVTKKVLKRTSIKSNKNKMRSDIYHYTYHYFDFVSMDSSTNLQAPPQAANFL